MSTCGLVNDRVLGFYSTDGGGVIKRLRHFVPAKVGSGEGGEASANESNFADFQSGVSLSLSLSLTVEPTETFSLQINLAGSPLLSLPFSD